MSSSQVNGNPTSSSSNNNNHQDHDSQHVSGEIDVDELAEQLHRARQQGNQTPPPVPAPAPAPAPAPKLTLTSSPRPSKRTPPPIKSIKEEIEMESSAAFLDLDDDAHADMHADATHLQPKRLSTDKLQQIRSSLIQPTPDYDHDMASVTSLPAITTNTSDSKYTKRFSFSKNKHSDAASVTSINTTNTSTSSKRNSSKRVWQGIKNVMSSVTKSTTSNTSPRRLRSDSRSTSPIQMPQFARSRSHNAQDTPNPLPHTHIDLSSSQPIRRAQTSPVPSTSNNNTTRGARFAQHQGAFSHSMTTHITTRKTPPDRHAARSRSESPLRRAASHLDELDPQLMAELEVIGKALKDGLTYTTITDRMKKKTFDRCFPGSAAVDFLSNYTQKPRLEALEIGRKLVRYFGLFVNTTGTKFHSNNGTAKGAQNQHNAFLLLDSTNNYYRMVAYLPSEVKRMNMMTKTRLFEEGVKVKTRRQGLRKHKKCFVGADAVNFLVRSRIVQTRPEAVELGRKFVSKFNLFEPVNRDHTFMDSRTKLYRFVDKRNRYFAIDNFLSTRMIQLGREDTDLDEPDPDPDADPDADPDDDGASSIGGKSSLSGSTRDSEEEQDTLVGDNDDPRASKEHQKLFDVADVMERGIKVTDNTKKAGGKKGLSYQDTFVAARAVTFMVTSGLAHNREEATALGRKLERELNLFREVSGKHNFSDANHYFRFTPKQDRFMKPIKAEKPLSEVAVMFEQGVKVKDYTYRLRTYKKTFMGSRAVDFLVNSRLASTRANAVRLGCQLVADFNLFEPVTGNKEFCDDLCYFRFTPPEQRRKPAATAPKRRSGRAFLLHRSSVSKATIGVKDVPDHLLRVAESFLNGVKVKEHKYRAKPYEQTFVGSDAVSFMVNSSLAQSRKEAVDLGKKLTEEVGLFLGIDGKKDFKDDYLLYRFSEKFEEQMGGNNMDKSRRITKSLPLDKIAEAFRGGVMVGDHKENGKLYKDTFLGSEAVDFLVGSGAADNRVDAVDLGRLVAREFSLFEHIHQECEFEDEDFLYSFCYQGPIRPLEVIQIETSRLMNIAKDFELCVKTKTNKIRLRKFKDTFLGSEAVDYLVNSCVASDRREAVQIGRAITKEFNLFEHVTNDRRFQDADIPYFFVKNSERYKGLNLQKKRARRNIFQNSDDELSEDESSSSEDNGSSSNIDQSSKSMTFSFQTEDAEWAKKMATFEKKMHNTQSYISTRNLFVDDDSSQSSSEVRMQQLHSKFSNWAKKFHRLDPRYQIRYFFDFVAQDGAEDAETRVLDADNLRALYNFLPSRAQVFTVWRPTSADAIRKMMLGEAVGKGLDIKGKSAKRGKMSGFVPFLQIGENKHKSKIRPPSKEGVVRVFYPGEARRGRDLAAEKLERVGLEMIETVKEAKKVLEDPEASKSARKDALDAMLLDMGDDPSIEYLDQYAPERYGLEIPERLFWEAFFTRQDITRKAGSEYDTGRPSQPAFQDMNFAAIRAEPKEDAPRAVVYQSADPDSPMNPFELLVAYEENGRVMPVVSDFDCFLVGTKRVQFESPLPTEQLDVLKWYVKNLEQVMKTSKVGDSWTVNWLEVLKKAAREGFYPEMPRFGFGDPKSYSIMKNAVSRLSHSGAVRHGAECFNYYFPQDLDDEFLVIANDLPDNKPWAYVDVEGLQDILEQKIEDGYTFPLNPKWVLADAYRWKELYDKLLKSDKLETQQSMRVWFPPDSGLREIIERVHAARPTGFYKGENNNAGTDSDSDTDVGNAGAKETMMSTVVALRLLEKFQARTKQFQESGGESNDDDSE